MKAMPITLCPFIALNNIKKKNGMEIKKEMHFTSRYDTKLIYNAL